MSKIIDLADKVSKALFFAIAIMSVFALSYELTSAQVTIFNNTASLTSLNLTFPQEFMTKTFFVRVPNGTVTEARMRIQGFNTQGLKGLPRDIIIVTDLSGSMSQAVQGVVKLVSAQEADKSFISNVDTNYIQVGLVNYSTVAQLNQPLITNKVTLNNSINRYRAGSYTNLGAALQLAINELNSVRAQRVGTKKFILLMTDGWPNCLSSGSCADNSATNRAAEAWILSLARTANSSNITIFAISFGDCGTTYTSGGGGSTAHCVFMQNVSNQTKGGLNFNAPNGQDLINIYNSIAEMIETTNLTTPTIRSTSPLSMFGWSYPDLYNGNALWNGASCGIASASCNDFRALIQSNLNVCSSNTCDIRFSVYSPTVGMLNLSELFIEINVPPIGNYPPMGNCLQVPMLCDQDAIYVGIDDTRLVTDANDALNTLTWRYDSSRLIESAGGSHFFWSNNNNFNSDRQLALLVDSAYLQNPFWRTFFFNITDPWGASTMSCINVSYAGCTQSVCGNGPPLELGEQCELNNTINNIYCNQTTLNCSQAPLAITRDYYGNCNSACGCVEDLWSEQARCIAGSCGAVCSNEQTQPCPAPGGFPGMQDCNTTTCQWNICKPEGICGDLLRNQASEQCEPNNNQKNPDCFQDNETCDGPRLATRPDQIGSCNAACECYNDSWSAAVCTANKCGAVCSDGETLNCSLPGGFPRIQACNTTTCQWGICRPEGVCGDRIINQEEEQCERSNTLNNSNCIQNTENCSDSPKVRIRDARGNCNANCGCINDSWSEPTCIAGICGASCTNGTSQACSTADGYPGIQTCDETTCNWNICTTTLSCGDNIISNPPESCEFPSTSNNTNCNQSIEQCVGPKIAARDSYGDCGALCICAYDIFGEAANCSVSKCEASCDITTPPEDCTTTSGHEGTRTCDLATCTMGGCTRNPLNCESSIPNYLLHTGQHISIDIDDIFSGDTGGADSISYSHSSALSITHDSSISAVDVSSDDATFETVDITIRVEGVDSQTCSVRFLNLDSRCDNPVCEAYADAKDFEGLRANNCLDNEIWVTDPHAAVRVSDYISNFLFPGFASRNLEYTADFEAFDGFGVFPSSGNRQTTFYITNLTNITHGTENSSVIKVTFDDYENAIQNYTRICPKLVRYHYNIGDLGYDPNSTLLITGSRSVTGYYEKDGFVFSKGPYIFIAKVWMRE